MKYKLSEIGKIVGGGTPSSKHEEYYTPNGIPWLTPKDLSNYTNMYISRGARDITEEGLKESSAKLLPAKSILVSSRAPIGYVAIADNSISTNQGFKSIVPNTDVVIPEYLYFVMKKSKAALEQVSSGSTFKEVSTKVMANFEVDIPSIEVQRKILTYLMPISQKIELNKRINDNLLEQAQAIYTKMFITDADSSWPEGKLSDLIEVCYGKDHKKLGDGDIPVYGSGGVMRHVDQALYEKESVLVPRKGTLNNVVYVNESFWSVDTMFFTKMKRQNVAKFVFHFLKGKDLASMNAGSAVPSMTAKILNAIPLKIPDDQSLSTFEAQVSPFYQAASYNKKESENLAAIRDTLLPKLMSGKIDVSDIDL